jgi:hypothetical protein
MSRSQFDQGLPVPVKTGDAIAEVRLHALSQLAQGCHRWDGSDPGEPPMTEIVAALSAFLSIGISCLTRSTPIAPARWCERLPAPEARG